MVSLIDRVNSIGTNKSQRSVGFGFGSNWSGIVGTLASRDVDLTDTKYSAALAYVFMYPVRVCVDLYSNAVPLIPHEIVYNTTHDPKNDKIVASSEDVGVSRLRIMEVFNDHRRQYNIDFLNALTHEYMLYNSHAVELLRPENEVLAQVARQHNRASGLKVLRGLGLTLQAYDGAIQYFQYNDDTGSVMLSPHDVAYDRGYNPFNDYYGVPLVYSILDDLNILNDLYRYLDRLLSKADRPDVIASFKDGTFTQNTQAQSQFAEMLERYKHSKSNFFTSNIPIDLLAVPAGQANDQMQVSEATKADIFAAFGVSPALVGDNQATTYQEGTNAYANWIRVKVLPLLINIENFINDNLMERFGLDRYYRFRFNTEKYDYVTEDDKTAVDVANAKFADGKITLGQWCDMVSEDCDESMREWRSIEGILVPPDAIGEIWRYKFQAPASEQLAQAQLTRQQTEAAQVTPVQPLALPPPKEDKPDTDLPTMADGSPIIEPPLPAKFMSIHDGINIDGDEPDLPLSHISVGDNHDAHIKAFIPRKATREIELSAYKKVAFKKYTRDFPLEWLRGDIGDVLATDIAASKGDTELIAKAFTTAQLSINKYHKALSATRIDFEEDFASLMRKALAENNFGRVQWSSATRSLIRRYGTQAYKDGLVEGGVFDAELGEDDLDTIATLIGEQSGYVTGLGEKLFKDEAVTEAMALQKPDAWWNKSISPFYEAGLMSVAANAMVEFVGDDGDESCETCQRLKGQRHRLKQWARKGLRPGTDSDQYICKGFKCKHYLQRVFAAARGTW